MREKPFSGSWINYGIVIQTNVVDMRLADRFIMDIDKALRVVSGTVKATRPNPAQQVMEGELSEREIRHSAGLMRVNHVGEVCAQALYDSQGRFARSKEVKDQFMHAGLEEEDHLAWTADRLRELGSHASLLNPLWYVGAYVLGTVAAKVGDARNLGFVAETENQVEQHLIGHLKELPQQDAKSRAIVEQMRCDEAEHSAAAKALGGAEMPVPLRKMMKFMARIMTATAYRI